MDVRVLVGEIASFQFVEELVDLLLVEQQGRNDDKAGRVFGNAFGEIDLWKRMGLHQSGDGVVHQIDGALARPARARAEAHP